MFIFTRYFFFCFFLPVQPVLIVVAILGGVLNQWVQKYNLFHHSKRPTSGTKILYRTTLQCIYGGFVFLALSTTIFTTIVPGIIFDRVITNILIANILNILFSILLIFLPMSQIYDLLNNRSDTSASDCSGANS